MAQPDRVGTRFRACPLCEAMCGIALELEDGAVRSIRGDPEDPFSRGHVCPKAVALLDLQADPDRLRRPLRRTPTGWEPLAWPEALDLAAAGLARVQEAHGRDAVAVYLGNPNVHNVGSLLYGPPFLRVLGTRNRFSATSVDQLPHHLAAALMFGHGLLLPVPDLDRTDFFLILGANPAVSNGSLMSAPGAARRIEAVRARGGRVVVVDPRRTETAALADTHHFIRPGTDAALLMALLQVLFEEGLDAPGRLAEVTDGLDEVRAAVSGVTPERVAPWTGVPAGAIRRLARDFAAADRAVCYGRLGVSTQAYGGLNLWLVNLLNLVTGNLDRPGGALFTRPAVDTVAHTGGGGRGPGRWRTRVRGLPEFMGELPVAALAEEMTTSGPGRIRALVTNAGNPVLSTPDGGRLDGALAGLDFMVSIDFYLNETTRHAHLILPPTAPLEHGHYDLAFNLLAVRNVARWSEAVVDPPAGALHDWQILSGLERRLARGVKGRLRAALRARLGPTGLLALGLRAGPYGTGLRPWGRGLTLGRLRRHPHGLDLGPLEPALPGRLRTPERRIRAAPEPFLADAVRLRADLDAQGRGEASSFDLSLIGRRHLRSNNAWMHNHPRLMKGRERCTLLMHPDDAAARGLADGDRVRITSRVGSVEAPLVVSDEVMPGVVSLPHGWGHGRPGVRLGVAQARPGVSVNDLTDAAEVDAASGNAVLNGVPVRVTGAGPGA